MRKKRMPSERASAGVNGVAFHEAGADHHFAAGLSQRLEDAGNIPRVVLPVTIHANDILESQLEGQLVSGLHGAAKSQMMGQSEHLRSGGPGHDDGRIERAIVNHQDRDVRHAGAHRTHHVADRGLLVKRRDQDQELRSQFGHLARADGMGAQQCRKGRG